jgi:hypothetical protein
MRISGQAAALGEERSDGFRRSGLARATRGRSGCDIVAMSNQTQPGTPVLIEVRDVDEAHIVGLYGATLIQIWRGAVSGTASRQMNRIARALVESNPAPVSSLFVVERSSPPPNDEGRKEFAAFSRDLVSRMSIAVVVAEGGGFRGSLVRAVGVTLTTLLPHSSKFKFVNDMAAAARLIEPHMTPGTGGAEGLIQAAEQLRQKIGSGAGR